MRVKHSRFFEGNLVNSDEKFDRIVTSVWEFDQKTNTLRYGATVFKKTSNNSHWDRKAHFSTAMGRFTCNPVVFHFKKENTHSNRDMARYITEDLIYKFGVCAKNSGKVFEVNNYYDFDENFRQTQVDKVEDYRIVHHYPNNDYSYFMVAFLCTTLVVSLGFKFF